MTVGASRHSARYYDGRTARAHRVAVEVEREGLSIFDADGVLVARWPADAILRVERPRRGEPVRLGLEGTTARLVVEHGWVVAALAAAAPPAAGGGRLMRRMVLRTSAWAVAAAGSAAAVVFVLIPLLAAQLAALTPEPIKQRVGEIALPRLAAAVAFPDGGGGKAEFCGFPGGVSALETLARRVTAGLESPPALRLVVVRADLVNAFALPGGYVVLTYGLIRAAESPEEVAGVLAHEVGHVAHDHATEAIYRTTAISMLVSLLVGDVTFGVAGAVTELAINGRHSREAERAADRFAVELLNASGIDGEGLVRFFERIAGRAGGEDHPLFRILSTHPPTRERAEEVRAIARAGAAALTEREWRRLRRVCGVVASEPRLVTLP